MIHVNMMQNLHEHNIIAYLSTECEVCKGKYVSEGFVNTERRKSEVCAEKLEGKSFHVQIEQTRLIRNLLYDC